MNKLFSDEGAFAYLFGHLGDIVIVNFLFVITSVPVVTAGASLCAMNHVFLKRRRASDEGAIRLYFEGFKANGKTGTAAWLVVLSAVIFLAVDRYAFTKSETFTNPLLSMFSAVLLAVTGFTALWLFAVIPAFCGSLKTHLLNAFRFAASHIVTTLLLAAVPSIVIWCALSDFVTFAVLLSAFLFFGFGLTGFLYSFLYIRAFAPFLDG